MSTANGDPHLTGALRRFAQRAADSAAARVERCDLCNDPVQADHRHLLETSTRAVMCACQACSLLFTRPAASQGRYRLIPDRRLRLTSFGLTDAEWNSLCVPVGMCFLVAGTDGQPRAFYPSPMGATEATVDPDTWSAILARYAVLSEMETDVEALLVNRTRGAREYFLVPIDSCFSLVGLIRMRWRGLSGGSQVWAAVDEFFSALRARSRAYPRMEVRA